MAYKKSRKADEDIINIYVEGAEEFGSAQAEKYHAELENIFQLLADNPQLARERTEITPPVRIHPHWPHVFVYHVDDRGDVFIIRVRKGRENWSEDPV